MSHGLRSKAAGEDQGDIQFNIFDPGTWLGGLGLNFLGGGWGEGWSVQWGASKLVAASCHCWRLPLVNVSSDLLARIIVNRESSIMRMFTTTMTMTVITWLKQDCCHC